MTPRGTFYWSIRRELWENRYLFIVPLVLAAIILLGFTFNAGNIAEKIQKLPTLEEAKQVKAAVNPYSLAAAALLFVGWVLAIFYSLEALHGERRDRSILFWKSMPVSDVTTVLAKAAIPLVVIPAIVVIVAWLTQAVMLLIITFVLMVKAIDPGILWSRMPFIQMPIGMVYGMAIHALWFAPMLAWMLLVSGMVRRAPIAWALLPFFAAFAVESIVFGTKYVALFLQSRWMGAMALGFKPDTLKEPVTQVAQLDPLRLLSSPSLWIGLAFAVFFIAAAIRLRRYREPN